MRSTSLAAAVLPLALVACAASSEGDDAPLGQTRQSIVGGTVSTSTQDATVLIRARGQFACTGTLIAANLVLTARHCVSQLNENTADACGQILADEPATSFSISLGVNAQTANAVATGTKVYVGSTSTSLCGNDIALIQLNANITGAMIAPVRFTALKVNELTTAVGYGDTGLGQTPTQRQQRTGIAVAVVGPANDTWQTQQGANIPVQVSAGEFATGDSTCFGDSGGPLFDAAGNVVGVTSRGLDDACIDRPSIWTAITTHEQLIRDALAGAGHPVATTASTSTTPSTASTSTTTSAATATPDEDDSTRPKVLSTNACAATPGGSDSPFAGIALALGCLVAVRRRRGPGDMDKKSGSPAHQ